MQKKWTISQEESATQAPQSTCATVATVPSAARARLLSAQPAPGAALGGPQGSWTASSERCSVIAEVRVVVVFTASMPQSLRKHKDSPNSSEQRSEPPNKPRRGWRPQSQLIRGPRHTGVDLGGLSSGQLLTTSTLPQGMFMENLETQ